MKTKLFFGMLTAAATLAVTPAAFAGTVTGSTNNGSDDTYTTTTGSTTIGTVSKEYKRNYTGSWTGTSVTTNGTVEGYELTIKTGSSSTDLDIYFTGDGTLTITNLTVENGTTNGATYKTTKAFIVEGTTVILSGVTVEELGMNLVVGTEYGAGDATLIISNGSNVSTGAYYSTVGSNLATGTITITGEGSTLSNQQITLGGGVNSMFPGSIAASGDYWTKNFVDTDTVYNPLIRDVLVSSDFVPTSGSYGIVNVENGGTWKVGVGNTDSSNNRIQLANGKINIDGGSLIFGSNSSLLMMNESLFSTTVDGKTAVYTGMNVSETVKVTNGGTVSVEKDAEGNAQTMTQLVIGDTYVASNVTAAVSVDGSDSEGNASSFVISASSAVYIGTNSGYWTNTSTQTSKYEGGTADVTVSATNGGVIDISSAGGMVICADNYATYIGATADGNKYDDVGHSYGLKVAITAESGGSLTLAATDGSTVMLAAGSPSTNGEYTNELTVKADGDGSSVAISGGDIYTNLGDTGEGSAAVSVEITATNGGTIALSAAKVGDVGNGVVSFGLNTQVTVKEGSSLTTEGIISFESGSSISVDATSKWTTTGTDTTVTFNEGSVIEIGAVATDNEDNAVNIAVGSVTISESASISVYVDVSALSSDTTSFVVNLMTGTFSEDFSADAFSSDAGNLTAKFSDETNWAYEYGLALDDSTLQLVVSRTYLPEPSMFGMLFGLSALGLVSTRRRRRKA